MAHMRISIYKLTGGTAQEVARLAQEGMLPIFRQQPGFIAYEGLGVGDDTLISVSTWQTVQDAEASSRQAANWIGQNVAGMLQLQSSYIGDVLFSSR